MSELNAYDILCNEVIVFTKDNLPGDVVVEVAVAKAPAKKSAKAAKAAEAAEASEEIVGDETAETEPS